MCECQRQILTFRRKLAERKLPEVGTNPVCLSALLAPWELGNSCSEDGYYILQKDLCTNQSAIASVHIRVLLGGIGTLYIKAKTSKGKILFLVRQLNIYDFNSKVSKLAAWPALLPISAM